MAAVGDASEAVLGSKSTVEIGAGNTYDLKRIYKISRMYPPDGDATPTGRHWSFGEAEHDFELEILASTPDMATIDGFVSRDSDGDITEKSVIVTFPPISAASAAVKATFNAKFYHDEITHVQPDGKVSMLLQAKITSDVITWS